MRAAMLKVEACLAVDITGVAACSTGRVSKVLDANAASSLGKHHLQPVLASRVA